MRILVVDDEPAVRTSLERALRLDGGPQQAAGC
jgi:DNA-binding response OmpR family regulator